MEFSEKATKELYNNISNYLDGVCDASNYKVSDLGIDTEVIGDIFKGRLIDAVKEKAAEKIEEY